MNQPTMPAQWSEQDTRDLIHEIIRDLAPEMGDIVSSARLIEELGFHSLSLLELAMSLEDEFALPAIDEEEARQIVTVGDVEHHVIVELRRSGRLMDG